ncbi:phosphoenolpyruvate--protein phosphotransferase [Sporomusa rhizae]|uniref:phosphoenolpyruvate--protein phosphotransferase n=1 Tax=Sporomusa rhizae TaxID=357999 RepID=UPI00352B774A
MLIGIAASPGIAIGKALILTEAVFAGEKSEVNGDQQQAFQEALEQSKQEIILLRQQVSQQTGEEAASVFDAHLLMLEDTSYVDPIREAIGQGADAVSAVQATMQQLVDLFRNMEDEYMRERAADITDISRRLIRNLTGSTAVDWGAIAEPVIVVAHDLTPSDTAQLDPSLVLGFAAESGGRTSHSAILARTLGIPAVVGTKALLSKIKDGQLVIVDGDTGNIVIDPDADTVMQFRQKAAAAAQVRAELALLKDQAAVTIDGCCVELAANIGGPRDIAPALANGAEAIGLYRTEFLFMDHEAAPTEEEQYQAYKAALEGMQGRAVVIRTLDVGGDKQIAYLDMPKEDNPFLGWRAVRMCLDRPELFKVQLRALWRAGCHGNLKVMFPMVSNLAEVKQAKHLLFQAREELLAEDRPVARKLQIGIMIELPAAALIVDQLASEVDFFSIGSNDLIQYTVGVDRMNENIAHLYQPLHPGVLRLIAMVIDAAHRQDKSVGMCGEMAGDLTCIPLLLGLGLDEFSMSAGSIPQAKKLIQSLSATECSKVAAKCLAAGEADEVRKQLAVLA